MCADKDFISKFIVGSDNLTIPESIKHIKIDIGLSYCAPNSDLWLRETKDRFIFGFEPNSECIRELITRGFANNPRYRLLNVALDNVLVPTIKDFYMTAEDPGCSSLYKPTNSLMYSIDKVVKVNVISFGDFLRILPWERFPFIEQVKIDAQGKDLDILYSAESFLDNIADVVVECTTFDYYEKKSKDDTLEITELLCKHDFECYLAKIIEVDRPEGRIKAVVDRAYRNKRFNGILSTLHTRVID